MFKVYRESPIFDEFTRFDTTSGRLETIPEEEFNAYLPDHLEWEENGPIRRVEGKGAVLFTGEIPATHTRFPRRVYFQITRHCNLNCPACFIKAGKAGQHVPTENIMEMASFLGRNGLMEVRITGGEPTTHPDFFEILHKFQEENIYVSVATNGVLNKKTLDALCEEKNLWVICSIDGNRETHNKYRPGTFDRILRNLKYLKNKNPSTRLRLTTVLTRENMGQMYDLGQICRTLDAESITIIPLRPQVRDPGILEKMVTAQEFKRVIENMIEVKKKLGIRFTTTLETDFEEYVYKDPIFRKKFACAAGREGTNLDYDYSKREFLVYGCSYSPAVDLAAIPEIRKPFLAGTFSPDRIHSFLDIWRNEQAWELFRNNSVKSPACKGCSYLKNFQCVGSCPIQNIDYDSLRVEGSILDQLKEQIRHTSEWYCYKAFL